MDDEDRYTRITLRIPKELHAKLSEQAARTSKSLNAQIVENLQSAEALRASLESTRGQLQATQSQLATAQEVELVRTRLAEILTGGFRRLVKAAAPETLTDPNIALAKTLLELIDGGGGGVASFLAERAAENDPMRRAFEGYADHEARAARLRKPKP